MYEKCHENACNNEIFVHASNKPDERLVCEECWKRYSVRYFRNKNNIFTSCFSAIYKRGHWKRAKDIICRCCHTDRQCEQAIILQEPDFILKGAL